MPSMLAKICKNYYIYNFRHQIHLLVATRLLWHQRIAGHPLQGSSDPEAWDPALMKMTEQGFLEEVVISNILVGNA